MSCFKPYYKWITFNTEKDSFEECLELQDVLNLIINGLPSIQKYVFNTTIIVNSGFKPYYKWITFNTRKIRILNRTLFFVLNLIINGLPSIPEMNMVLS